MSKKNSRGQLEPRALKRKLESLRLRTDDLQKKIGEARALAETRRLSIYEIGHLIKEESYVEKRLAQVEELERSLKEPLQDFDVIPDLEPDDWILVDTDVSRAALNQVDSGFRWTAMFLDLILEPDAAEDAIGDLAELYARRRAVNPGHAKRWLIAQVLWIVYGRAMDVFGRFMRARAGK